MLTPLAAFDIVLGFAGGRPDLFVTAAITVSALAWLHRRVARRDPADRLRDRLPLQQPAPPATPPGR